jgi:hypothetical protein
VEPLSAPVQSLASTTGKCVDHSFKVTDMPKRQQDNTRDNRSQLNILLKDNLFPNFNGKFKFKLFQNYIQLGYDELASGDWREGGGVIPLVIFLPRGYVTHKTELY